MKLEGSYEVRAPRQKVWSAFLDPETLRKAIPGCEKLEMVAPDEYKATLKIGVAAVKGTFEGKVRLSDKKPSDSYRLAAEGSGGPGFVRGRHADLAERISRAARGSRTAPTCRSAASSPAWANG